MRLHDYLILANSFNEYFGAKHASVQESADNENGLSYAVLYWTESLDYPGTKKSKIIGISKTSLNDAILNAILQKTGSIEQATEIFNNTKQLIA